MTALFINLRINEQEKLDLFKITLSDIEHLFNECHIKIRGLLANECIIFARELLSDRAQFYQELQETDWVAASLLMIENVRSRYIFSYLEDHRLIVPPNDLSIVLKEFDKHQLDYLNYSFFRASRLDTNNLLPLNPKDGKKISQFFLDKKNIKLLSKISPLYCNFSLSSICSADYFKKLLHNENKKFKIYLRKLSSLLAIIFSYPKYKIVINFINFFLSFLNSRLCFYPIDTPFNMEKLNIEMNSFEGNSFKKKLKFGVLKNELFANFDDDNNAYGESLIKKGLYPFDIKKEVNHEIQNHVNHTIKLGVGDFYNCTYYSQIHRIRVLPRIFIKVNYGKLTVNYNNEDIVIEKGDYKGFYTNLSPVINCLEDSEIVISVYDECFN
tara:strand:- start:6017 stop:7168 length:1152 start_codon:yes stop_codon:yes gene_type:complete